MMDGDGWGKRERNVMETDARHKLNNRMEKKFKGACVQFSIELCDIPALGTRTSLTLRSTRKAYCTVQYDADTVRYHGWLSYVYG